VVLRKTRPEKGGSRDEDCVVDAREKNCVVEDVCDNAWEKTKVGEDQTWEKTEEECVEAMWEKRRMRENKLARSKIPDGCRESDSRFIGVCFGGAVVQGYAVKIGVF